MKKIFYISTFIIMSSLMLTGCGIKEKEVENKYSEELKNIDTIKDISDNKGNLKEQLIESLDNINKIIEDAEATNDKKIESLQQELNKLNILKESEMNDENFKEALNLLIDGVNKQIEFLVGTNEYHKGNKTEKYKEELVSIAYEATDLILAVEIMIK